MNGQEFPDYNREILMSEAKQAGDGNPEHSVVLSRTDRLSPEIPARSQSAAIRSVRKQIQEKMKHANEAQRDAGKRGDAEGVEYHWGVYSGLSLAAGICWRAMRKESQVEQEAMTPPAD